MRHLSALWILVCVALANGSGAPPQAPVPVLANRVATGESRPLLAGDPVGALTRLGATREAAYEATAHVRVDTGARDVDGAADAVLDLYLGADA